MIGPILDLKSTAVSNAADGASRTSPATDYSDVARSAERARRADSDEARDANPDERRSSTDDPGMAAALASPGQAASAEASRGSAGSEREGSRAAAGSSNRSGDETTAAKSRPAPAETASPPAGDAPDRVAESPMTAAGPEAGDDALQDASGDDAALAARIKNRQSASDEIDAGEPQRPGRTHRLDVTDAGVAAKAAENASRRVTAPGSRLGVTGPPDSEEAALSQAVAAATKATAAGPADAARSAPMAGLGGVIARALQRALGGLEEGLGNALKKNIGGDRQAIVSALAAGAAPAAPLGAAPLTATALTAPEAAARSGSVADALASLHIDDAGVAVIRVERTSLGAIEAHVARHGADISVRLRAVEAENQARLLHALPAVRRELDASELVVGRVDVRGDVPADAFGSGASKHQAAADGRDPGEGFDAGEPEPASPRQPGISRLASGAATQTGERRRLLVIA